MAFELATISLKPASVGTGVKAILKKRSSKPATLSINITGTTFTKVGWSDGDKIVVQIGTGEHHGLVRLQKNNSTGQAVYQVKKGGRSGIDYGMLALGHQDAFVDRAEDAAWCQWDEVDGGVLEIVLPKWADETGPKARSRPQVGAAPTPAPSFPFRRKENVTASLMGDPEPGRSALAERNR